MNINSNSSVGRREDSSLPFRRYDFERLDGVIIQAAVVLCYLSAHVPLQRQRSKVERTCSKAGTCKCL